jgi:hypothetical protein
MDKVLGLFIWIKAKLAEPSTMASLAAVSSMVGVQMDPGTIHNVINVLTLVFGALGFFFKESGPITKV